MIVTYKALLALYAGAIGGFILSCFGGWTEAMTTLLIFMVIDVLTGLAGAIMQRSDKTDTGGLSSKTMTSGLIRKALILLVIIVAAQIDHLLHVDYVKNMSVIAFCINEVISIFENVGLAGIKLPGFLTKTIDLLNKKYNLEEQHNDPD